MSRRPRLATVAVAVVIALGTLGCGDDGGGSETDSGDTLTREQGITILLGQGYNQDSAACAIDEAARQDVDVLDVLTRDQVTARELSVLAAVQEYCVDRLGGSTIPTPSGTPDSAPTSVSD
jgi:hypothetical protein